MQTIFIYDQCCEDAIKFFIVEGDYSHLNNVYINGRGTEEQRDELYNLLYENEEERQKFLKRFPVKKVDEQTKVVTVGFMP